jgi:hypothetical protein
MYSSAVPAYYQPASTPAHTERPFGPIVTLKVVAQPLFMHAIAAAAAAAAGGPVLTTAAAANMQSSAHNVDFSLFSRAL